MTDDRDFSEFDLPLSIEGGAEKIPAQYRQFYQPDQSGAYHLADPVLKRRLDDARWKTVVQKERTARREKEKLANEQGRILSHLVETLGAINDAELPSKAQELIGRTSPSATDAMRTEIENTFKRSYDARLAAKEAEAAKFKKALQVKMIDQEVTSAIASAKGNLRFLTLHVRASMGLREENGELFARVIDQNGEVRYRSDGLPMTAADVVTELRKDPDFVASFESDSGTRGSGGGSGGNGGGPGSRSLVKTLDKAEWRMLLAKAKPDERAQYLRDAAAGRYQVTE